MSAFSIAEPDITLHLDEHDVIREVAASSTVSGEAIEGWVGRSWPETIAGESGRDVRRMIDDARAVGVSAFGKILQRFPSGRELPFEVTTIRMTGHAAGRKGGLLVLGKSLQVVADLQSRLAAAQQATEREYWKSRDVETRYRLLFDASDEAVLMVRGDDFVVTEANPAALRCFGFAPGWVFTTGLDGAEAEAFQSMLRHVREHGRAPGLILHPGTERAPVAVRASVVAAERGLHYLLHLAPAGSHSAPPPPARERAVEELIERLPDGVVVIGADGVVERVNRAFLDQLGIAAAGGVVGENLGRWLSHPGADAAVLLATLRRHGSVVAVRTVLYGELGTETPVEISGATGVGDARRCFVLVSRDVGRRDATEAAMLPAALLDASARQLGELTLQQIVKQTADAVENHVIKVALDRAQGNRTAAAEILGLSRQSLHAKLNRQAAEGVHGVAAGSHHGEPAASNANGPAAHGFSAALAG